MSQCRADLMHSEADDSGFSSARGAGVAELVNEGDLNDLGCAREAT
jgi:hypothetical protein